MAKTNETAGKKVTNRKEKNRKNLKEKEVSENTNVVNVGLICC